MLVARSLAVAVLPGRRELARASSDPETVRLARATMTGEAVIACLLIAAGLIGLLVLG